MSIQINYEGRLFQLNPKESVLGALERCGFQVPYSCRVGVCHFCILKITKGDVPERAMAGLDKSLIDTKHFKACVCFPTESIEFENPYLPKHLGKVKVYLKEYEKTSIGRLAGEFANQFDWRSGQVFTLYAKGIRVECALLEEGEKLTCFETIYDKNSTLGRKIERLVEHDYVYFRGPIQNLDEIFNRKSIAIFCSGPAIATLYALCSRALKMKSIESVHVVQVKLKEGFLADEFRVLARNHNSTLKYQEIDGIKDLSSSGLRCVALTHNTKQSRVFIYLENGMFRHVKKHAFLKKKV